MSSNLSLREKAKRLAILVLTGFAFSFVGLPESSWGQFCPPNERVRKTEEKKIADIRNGRELFLHQWKPNDPLSGEGDGLGPMFNATSCVACHFQGGPGGGGDNQHNVLMLSVKLPTNLSRVQAANLEQNAMRIHSGFMQDGMISQSLMFHRKSTDIEYRAFRQTLLGAKSKTLPSQRGKYTEEQLARHLAESPGTFRVPRKHGINMVITQRNTPPLFGVGQIDQITEDTLSQIAETQSKVRDGVSGRLAFSGSGNVGRFGWRGQMSTTREFVLAACAAELGLTTKDHDQTGNPLTRTQWQKVARQPIKPKPDMTVAQSEQMVDFVRALPRPRQILPKDPNRLAAVMEGEKIFNAIRCNVCHVKDVDRVDGVFSDFLLHHMGKKLEDPIPARGAKDVEGPRRSGSYMGAPRRLIASVSEKDKQEWQTPPLWGVADSAPYLHDGRAETLHDAIMFHGGEAATSALRYRTLKTHEREKLVAFLNTLKAPTINEISNITRTRSEIARRLDDEKEIARIRQQIENNWKHSPR